MKSYFFALVFGLSLISIQAASAATLSLTNVIGGAADSIGPNQSVSGSSDGTTITLFGMKIPFSVWSLNVSEATSVHFELSGDVTSFQTIIENGSGIPQPFLTSSFDAVYTAAGQYLLAVLPSTLGVPYSFTATSVGKNVDNVGNVPIPAAFWLFGSALTGLIGMACRKSRAILTLAA